MISPVPVQTAPIEPQGLFDSIWLRWFTSVREAVNTAYTMAYIAVSENYSVTERDYAIEVTASGKRITLPDPKNRAGRGYEVYNTSDGSISVDNVLTTVIMLNGENALFRSNGVKWLKIW